MRVCFMPSDIDATGRANGRLIASAPEMAAEIARLRAERDAACLDRDRAISELQNAYARAEAAEAECNRLDREKQSLRAEPTERELSTFEYDCRRWDSTRALRNFVATRAAHTAGNHQEKDRA